MSRYARSAPLPDCDLPSLALVGAEILDVERAAVGYVEQSLPSRVDGEAAEVAADPAPAEPLRDRQRRPGPAEEVGNEISLISRLRMIRSTSASGFWVGYPMRSSAWRINPAERLHIHPYVLQGDARVSRPAYRFRAGESRLSCSRAILAVEARRSSISTPSTDP